MNLNYDEEIKREKRKKILKECLIWLIEIIVVILVAYLLITVCAKKTITIGSAMEPTLYNGQEVFINTKAYLIFSPDREDVIAFYEKKEENDSEEPSTMIRRIIGLPGEKIKIADGKIWIDGEKIDESYEYPEMTTGGVAEEEITLGEEEYFVLCDSRVDTDDSRNVSFGMVKESQIVGKVYFKFGPFARVTGPNKEAFATATPTP